MNALLKLESLAAALAVVAVGYVAYRAKAALDRLPQNPAKAAADFVDGVIEGGSLQAGLDNAENPACNDPADPLCVKRATPPGGKYPLYDEDGYPIKWDKDKGDFVRTGPKEERNGSD